MLFNSYIFLCLFLPITLIGFFLFGKRGLNNLAILWLVVASFVFYSWWNIAYLWLLLWSIVFNYVFGVILSRYHDKEKNGKWLLAIGVTANLGLLAYYKYSYFFLSEINSAVGAGWNLTPVLLPLAISFFTFQQIAYLVDAHRGETYEYSFLHYCLFVTFFPQLIAGPIVHHKEMLPQFATRKIFRFNYEQLSIGLTIFTIGLFKKVVLADGVARYATPVFEAVERGVSLTIFEAWGGAVAYTLQLYFDFSGYSDMAIGLASMIGVRLPLNFYSPYKATNIIDFWRRWHMTLSRFLRDYLYIPLGGNRYGNYRRYSNLLVTMLLGGLWHGANWTFVIWGALHGFYIILNHGWRFLRRKKCWMKEDKESKVYISCARTLTFLAVVIGWVFFRANNVDDACLIVSAMFGENGISFFPGVLERVGLQESVFLAYGFVFDGPFSNGLVNWYFGSAIILFLMFAVWFAPNTYQIVRKYNPALVVYHQQEDGLAESAKSSPGWSLNLKCAAIMGFLLACSLIVIGARQDISEFLYFQF